MSIGHCIARKRKELGLSQEALGAQLGVSRQSIYKWESDAALPEIEKLIALSRLFGVSVGWLLGVEEEAAPAESVSENSGELTEVQLQMVEEIVGRYIAAQPGSMSPKRRRVFKAAIAAAAVCLVLVLHSLFQRLDRVDRQYDSLQSSVNNVTSSVNSQIGGISDRVEEILKSQNDLTADYSTELFRVNYEKNQALFHARAVPKTFQEGMEVRFQITNGNGGSTVPGERDLRGAYTATLAEELTDHIEISVLFTYPDGTTQTQLLDGYEGLYSDSLPAVSLFYYLMWTKLEEPGNLVIGEQNGTPYAYIQDADPATTAATATGPNGEILNGPAEIAGIRVGLFKNQKLVAWGEPCERPSSYHGFEGCSFYRFPDLTLPLTPADTVQAAAVVEDVYGRITICPDTAYTMDGEEMELVYATGGEHSWDRDPALWKLE